MDYIGAREAAENWGISQRRVAILCSENRIPKAEMIGNMWLIPKETEKPIDARSFRTTLFIQAKPFVKWAGGKTQLIPEIKKHFPKQFGKILRKYAEPFVGGGALLFDILSNYSLDEVYISDRNAELINLYKNIRDNVDELIDLLKNYQKQYIPLDNENRKIYFNNQRFLFNQNKKSKITNTETAALFIFLNRTCFNGLYRVNSKNEYNVPMGDYKNPLICDEENLREVACALSNVEIVCGDYRLSKKFIDQNTLVYFDPPYRPLTTSASFTSYTENSFDDTNQKELAQYVQEISGIGAFVIESNSDPKNTDPNDNFFDNLYSKQHIFRISATRRINSKGNSRGKISELLICNFEE